MEPKITSREAFTVAGWMYHGRNEHNEIPQIWDNIFLPRMNDIKHRTEMGVSYGVMGNYDPQTGEFDYLAGAQVDSVDDLLPGMDIWQIPKQTYAAYPCILADIGKTFDYLYNTWLPASVYERTDGPEYEYYGLEFTTVSDPAKSIMYLYIPVRLKGK